MLPHLRWLLAPIVGALIPAPALAQNADRCAPLGFVSNSEFRNVTEPGDVRILPADKTILINKRIPEATRVLVGLGVKSHTVIVKDCSGTAADFNVTISGKIAEGEYVLDSNYASIALRRVGKGWMLQ